MLLSRKREEIPDFMSSEDFCRCFTQRFDCAHLPAPHMTRSIGRAFSVTFTTAVIGPKLRLFEISPYRAILMGPPSSLELHDAVGSS
jgi:hypothetical protein